MDEQNKQEEKVEDVKVEPTKDKPEGSVAESTKLIDDANEAAERMARQNDRKEELIAREEALHIKQKLGGESEAGQTIEPKKKLTDEEYAEALQKGEVNPLKEDGFI